MAFERIADEPRPLLPQSLEDRLVGLLSRMAGIAFIGLAAAGWLSIITWSAQDPSLTHATGGTTRNWLGPIGAILSDLLLQMLGFVAVFVFLGFAAWGIELILRERIRGMKFRAILLGGSFLVLAGAFSAIPAPSSWPLNHGLGGIGGDIIFGFVAGFCSLINPARAGTASGLVLFAAGVCLLSAGLGLTQREWSMLVQNSAKPGFVRGIVRKVWGRRNHPSDFAPAASWDDAPSHKHNSAASHAASDSESSADLRNEPPLSDADSDGLERQETTFDRFTERDSRAMAARFAPPGVVPAPPPPLEAPRRPAAEKLGGLMAFRRPEPAYRRPSLNFLRRPAATRPGSEVAQSVLRGNAGLLKEVLHDFGIKGEMKDIRPGPVVTLFEMEPARGTKSSRIIALADDIARSMSAISTRVAVVPGRNVIGIELPNVKRETVYLRELMESEAWRTTDAQLPIILGKGIGGEPIIADLARMPHLLIAGTTGSGKSVGVNAMILSLLYRLAPSDCRFLMIDPKMLELSVYNGIPHLLAPVVTNPHRAAGALNWAVSEMEERYKRMAQLGVRNIEIYNNRVRNAKKRGEMMSRTVQTGFDERTGQPIYVKERIEAEPMPYIVIVVDEFADLMVVAGKEVEGAVQRLAQMARAAGIHLMMATQRPSVDVVTGTIKANFPTRIAFKVASKVDSRTILNEQGAEQLLGAGDMLYSAGSGQVTRVHGPFVSDEEVERIAAALREQGEPVYVDALMRPPEENPETPPAGRGTELASEDLYDRAVAIVHRDQKASTSYIQRRLSIGYNRAADLIERMEREGLISAADSVGRRRILIDPSEAAE